MADEFKHIVLISIDALRADCIKSSPRYGEFRKKYKTSVNLNTKVVDEILKSGIYYNNCYSTAPYTSASHASYFTGFFPLHHNVYEFFNRKINKPTIFEYAKKSGYKTIFKTDFPIILGQYLGFLKGIDKNYIEDENEALKELLRSKNDKSLSFFHFAGVHYPYGFHNLKYGADDYVAKVNFLEKKYKLILQNQGKLVDVLDETFRNSEDRKLLLRYKTVIEVLYNNEKYNDLFNLYLEGINYFIAKRFTQFIQTIVKFVNENNGLLIIFSDHGEEWDNESYGHHNSLSDAVLRVPLIIYWNGIKHKIVNDLVRTIDLAPSLLPLISTDFKRINMDGEPLDLLNDDRNDLSQRLALAQVWLTKVKKEELFSFQRKAIVKNKIEKPLPTTLSQEMAHDQYSKLLITYNKDGAVISRQFTDYFKSKVIKNRIKVLEQALKKYNLSKTSGGRKLGSISHTIKKQLEDLGYKV